MLRNHLIAGWRNIIAAKGFFAINVCGLAAGMAVAMLIGLWVFDETGYNKSFANYDRLAQLYHHVAFGEEILTIPDVPAPIANVVESNHPGFESVTVTSWPEEHVVAVDETVLSETGLFVGPGFTEMFSIGMIRGTGDLADPGTVLLSERLGRLLFGDAPLGQTIRFENRDYLTVAGVYSDFPSNSQFAGTDMLLPMAYYAGIDEAHREQLLNWEDYSFQCFVMLDEHASLPEAESRIKAVLFENSSDEVKAIRPEGILFPMWKWHLYADFENGTNTGGDVRYVWMFGIIGIFVLLLACVNFVNLSTARGEKRSKEVGVRKVMGSARGQLMIQFIAESTITAAAGFVLALVIAALTLPWFSDLSGKDITMPWGDPAFIGASAGFIIITGFLAGSYPAFYLSSFGPLTAIRGRNVAGRFSQWPRRILVVFQFTVSIILIIGTLVVFHQLRYGKDRPAGFDMDGIFHVEVRTEGLATAGYNALRNELLASGVVENMATSDHPVTGSMSADASLTWEGKDPAVQPLFAINSCSHDFPGTNGFQFVRGRDFSREYGTDSTAVIVNEMGAKLLGGDNVIGKKMRFGAGTERQVVGVIRDQVRWSPFAKQSPHLYYVSYANRGYLTIRLKPQVAVSDALRKVEAVVKQFDPGAPLQYEFLDDDYGGMFDRERRFGALAAVFSGLAVFISCIGIFGLAAFAAGSRTREIGVRKVLGASVFSLWKLLCSEFFWLAVISVIVASSPAYILARRWLEQYEYRTDITWPVFAIAAALVLAVTLLTVSYQALRAAGMNPVRSLRVE